MQSEEKRDIIVPMFKDYIELKNKFLENAKDYLGNNCPVFLYEYHNMKFLHILYGNVGWNSKKGGFLLCSCNRIESKHQCKIIDDEQHLKLYKKARKKYKQLISAGTPEYKVPEMINKWASENNLGVNGLGISPEILPISRVRFDTMHMSMNITRRLLNHFEMLV